MGKHCLPCTNQYIRKFPVAAYLARYLQRNQLSTLAQRIMISKITLENFFGFRYPATRVVLRITKKKTI
jgi:hypothetical protein